MFRLRVLVFSALMAVLASSAAEAGRIHYGTMPFLELVAPTQIPLGAGSDKKMSLCRLVTKTYIGFVPLYYSNGGYVLSDQNCTGETYYSLSAAQFDEAQAQGQVASDIPKSARLTALQTAVPWIWGSLVGLGLYKFARRRMRDDERHREIGSQSKVVTQLVDAMCHVAKADGRVDEREVGLIAAIALRMTGKQYPEDQIRRMIDLSAPKLTPAQFAGFGKGLNPAQKEMVMRAVLMVAGADGEVGKKEEVFINGLGRGLGLTQARFNQIATEALSATA